jgi:hypothetical protein
MTGPNDHDMLVEIYTIVKRLDIDMNGNGRPGIKEQVAVLKDSVEDIKAGAPSSKEKKVGWAAIAVAIITSIGGVLANVVS